MTRRAELPRFADLRRGGNMPLPGRGNIRGGLALMITFVGALWLAHGFGF